MRINNNFISYHCTGFSNAHFGHPRNVIKPSKNKCMSDGWETARRLDRPVIIEANDDGTLRYTGKTNYVTKTNIFFYCIVRKGTDRIKSGSIEKCLLRTPIAQKSYAHYRHYFSQNNAPLILGSWGRWLLSTFHKNQRKNNFTLVFCLTIISFRHLSQSITLTCCV